MRKLSTGHGERTELPADYREVAESWDGGVMRTSRYPDTTVGNPIDWSMEAHDGSWLFRFHNMEYLFSVYRTLDETGDERYRALAERVIHSWLTAHPVAEEGTPPWMRHTTAMRAQALSFAAGYISPSDGFVAGLRQHGAFLADPANYSGAWNHGFDESLALLAVGATLGEEAWISLAVERASDAIGVMCDLQGATNEQASVYHFYVWKQFGQFEAELDRCGLPHPPVLQRRAAIVDFLVHASQPDRYLVPVGDSLRTLVPGIPGTPLEYTASQGSSGEPPARRAQVFERGWAFARTGWGIERPFESESMLTVRFGPGRAVHGHSDHTSLYYYAHGRPVVGDAGFSGYGDPARRAYELNEYAHSQVVVGGAGPYRATAETALLQHTEAEGWDQFVLQDFPYRGVKRSRTITFVRDPECLVIHDAIVVPGEGAVVRQLLHMGPSLEEHQQQGQAGVLLSDEAGHVEVRHLLPVSNIDVTRGAPSSATSGWTGIGLGKRAPSALITSRALVGGKGAQFLTAIAPSVAPEIVLAKDALQIGTHAIAVPTMREVEFRV